MASGLNRFFLQDTRAFSTTNYLTTAGVFQVSDQVNAVDLRKVGDGQLQVVRIAPTMQSAESDDAPIPAYWVPQGGSFDVPVLATDRKFVFTPDFSGCSLLVDQISDRTYRVYHVTGGSSYLQTEYKNRRASGAMLAAALTHEGYGTRESPRALLFMKFEEGRWWIYYQGQTGAGYGLVAGDQVQRVQGSTAADTIRSAGRMPVANVLKGEVPVFTADRLCDGQLVVPRPPSPNPAVRKPNAPQLMTNLWIY
ncbi:MULTISPECIES: hypothetical protein [unclassified Burkholderia]|uniref:hypothetical protein n=1 Tax=unclassified Burkholderia TaxID=2613784 RepID=UPI000469F7BB|nr:MULTISPECIES: hypothetical protein [unclassified Burkholderia]NIE87537.1 hypothetical protein [Burkholderia sp. Tr-860]NIF63764.1 hypothetical protein [Burkholderia sp. Cy-647]NIF69416.1 hypothetical protein [Burkholderia sp. Ap-962]NIF89455.1 hypothetical protein [Burkholderia sp. Cy-637]NIF95795.1 hypothetical protein [Burkholderia sp. Ax-1720]